MNLIFLKKWDKETILTGFSKDDFRAFLKEAINEGYEIRERNEWLNIGEVSRIFDMKVKTVYAKTSKRIIPHYKKGKN